MQFTCENCQRRYSLSDDKVRGKQVKVRCKSCDHVTTVSLPAESPAPEVEERTSVVNSQTLDALRKEAAAGLRRDDAAAGGNLSVPGGRGLKPKLDVSAQWFAMVKGVQTGPLDAGMLGAKLRSGELHARTYIWKQGMADWKRAEEIPEVAALLSPPAPAPPPVAPPPVAKAVPAVTRPQQTLNVRPRVAEPIPDDEPLAPAASREPELREDFDEDEAFQSAPASEPFETQRQTARTEERPSLDTLFSDEDLPPPEEPAQPTSKKKTSEAEQEQDPFAQLGGDVPDQPPGEATRFFMAQAGVTRRNPPWKIALFVIAGIGLPVLILFALSQMNVVPLTVTHVNAQGEEVKESVFSSGGLSGLGDILLGKNKQQAKAPNVAPEKKTPVAKKAPDEKPQPAKQDGKSQEELAAFYGSNELKTVGPKVKIEAAKPALEKGGGLDEEQVSKVVGQSMTAFQSCIENELRKNPNLKVGKIVVSATVGSSGTVTHADIDKADVSKSPLGDCLKNRARRMVFTAFAGDEEAEVQIPLMVTTGM